MWPRQGGLRGASYFSHSGSQTLVPIFAQLCSVGTDLLPTAEAICLLIPFLPFISNRTTNFYLGTWSLKWKIAFPSFYWCLTKILSMSYKWQPNFSTNIRSAVLSWDRPYFPQQKQYDQTGFQLASTTWAWEPNMWLYNLIRMSLMSGWLVSLTRENNVHVITGSGLCGLTWSHPWRDTEIWERCHNGKMFTCFGK